MTIGASPFSGMRIGWQKNSRHPEWCYADGSYLGHEELYAKVYEVLRRAGASPRPIDRDALAAYIRKYEPMMTDQVHREHLLRWCHENGIG